MFSRFPKQIHIGSDLCHRVSNHQEKVSNGGFVVGCFLLGFKTLKRGFDWGPTGQFSRFPSVVCCQEGSDPYVCMYVKNEAIRQWKGDKKTTKKVRVGLKWGRRKWHISV